MRTGRAEVHVCGKFASFSSGPGFFQPPEPSLPGTMIMNSRQKPWRPSFIRRQEDALNTGTRAIKVVTDQGVGYLKALGDPEGPHVLVCELVGSRLARWFGLPTFEFGVIAVIAKYGLTFFEGQEVEPGPAFITR